MTRVFIGGSRRITRLNSSIRARLDKIISQGFPVLVGDANGADKAVQTYLNQRNYANVEVFCMSGRCRNNVGNWAMRQISAPKGKRGFDFFSLKDIEMTKEASVGLMLWDGVSRGTLANLSRLVSQQKKAVVYVAPKRQFETIRNENDLKRLTTQSVLSIQPENGRQSQALMGKLHHSDAARTT